MYMDTTRLCGRLLLLGAAHGLTEGVRAAVHRACVPQLPASASRRLAPQLGFRDALCSRFRGAKQQRPPPAVVAPPSRPDPTPTDRQRLLATADAHHAAGEVDECFRCLLGADRSDDDLAWRVARAHHDLAEETVGDDATRERLLCEGLAIADAAARRSGSGLALKWYRRRRALKDRPWIGDALTFLESTHVRRYAILLGRLGDFLPTKEKVANSFEIKRTLEAASAELPTDSSVLTALGQWSFKVCSISWAERSAATLLFGAPPESSFDEALGFAERSYRLRPSKKAAALAAQSATRLHRLAEARSWWERVLELESAGEADAAVDRQAAAALGHKGRAP